MYKIGDKVMVASENDNEGYDDFRNEVLIITYIATSTSEHLGYDTTMNGMQLMELKKENGMDINSALYEYEVEPV